MKNCVICPRRVMHKWEVNYRAYKVLLRRNKTEHTQNSSVPEKAAYLGERWQNTNVEGDGGGSEMIIEWKGIVIWFPSVSYQELELSDQQVSA